MMQSINEVLEGSPLTAYKGSQTTKSMIFEAIKKRWGEDEARRYDPYRNTRTYKSWRDSGFKIRPKERALKSITYVEVKDKNGKVVKKTYRPVNLFYYKQVEKIAL